jgi:hypothetical protein
MAAVFKRQKPWAERIKPGQAYPIDEASVSTRPSRTSRSAARR